MTEEFLNLVSRDLLFIESDPDQTRPSDPTRGFIVDDVIRSDETKCPYSNAGQKIFMLKFERFLTRRIDQICSSETPLYNHEIFTKKTLRNKEKFRPQIKSVLSLSIQFSEQSITRGTCLNLSSRKV